MKRWVKWCVIAALLTWCVSASAQSLGDVARKQKQEKRPAAKRVYTNDDIPSVRQAEAAPVTPAAPSEAVQGAEGKPADKAAAPDQDKQKDKDKAAKEYATKAGDLKKEISQLQREIDVLQRENKLRVATYYADAGNSLRDPKLWAEQQRQAQADIDSKQKALADAKQKLTDLQEQARRAGISLAE